MGVCVSKKHQSGKIIKSNNNDNLRFFEQTLFNSTNVSTSYTIDNFIFYQSTKESDNIKLISIQKGYIEYKYIRHWEELLLNAEKKVLNENSNTSKIYTKSNISSLLEVLYRENSDKLCSYLERGPPNNLRWLVWMAIVRNKYHYYKEEGNMSINNNNVNVVYSNNNTLSNTPNTNHSKKQSDFPQNRPDNENLYLYFLSKSLPERLEEQIVKDLHRTAPYINFFKGETSPGMKSLYNILKALALYDIELAYCQGINILAAYTLLVSDGNEVESFYFIRFLFSNNFGLRLKDFYTRGFPKLHLYIYIAKKLIEVHLHPIHLKLEEIIPSGHDEIWLFKWIQSLFTHIVDFAITVRLWDCILSKGLDFIFSYTLAFLKVFETDIFKAEDIGDFIYIFKNNDIINSKNNPNKIEEVNLFRDKLINLALNFWDKIKSEEIEMIKAEYGKDPNNFNHYMDFDSCFSACESSRKNMNNFNNNMNSNRSNNSNMSILTLKGRRISILSDYQIGVENIPNSVKKSLSSLKRNKTNKTSDTNFSKYFSTINDEKPNKTDKVKGKAQIKRKKKFVKKN